MAKKTMFHSLWSRFQNLWTFYFYCSASSSEQSWILTHMTHWQMNYVMLFRARKGTKWTCLEIYFSRLQLVLWCLLLSVNSWLCPSVHPSTHTHTHSFFQCVHRSGLQSIKRPDLSSLNANSSFFRGIPNWGPPLLEQEEVGLRSKLRPC